MGLMEVRGKMALSAISQSQSTDSTKTESLAAPRKKRTFDIAFLTGQSETSSEATSITTTSVRSHNSVVGIGRSNRSSPALDHEDDYQPFAITQAAPAKTESTNTTNHNFSSATTTPCRSRSGNSSSSSSQSIDVMNNGCSGQSDIGIGTGEHSPKYKLYEPFGHNNSNSNGFLVHNLWKDRSNDKSGSKSNKGRKYNKNPAKSSQEIRLDSKKCNDIIQLNSSYSDHASSHHHHKGSSKTDLSEFRGHLSTNNAINEQSLSSSTFPHNIPPSAFPFLPQIGRFPIHLSPSSFGSLNNNHHNLPIPHPFSPALVNEKLLSKEHHQHIISAFHHHQQQQQNTLSKIRAGGFSPESLLGNPYSPYSSYPSAAAAALLLSQDLNRSPNLGLINPNSASSPPTSSPNQQHHNHNAGVAISNGASTSSAINTLTTTCATTTLLPPSLASLTLPAQNVCAKCNIGFRMTSDLVYHMRSHHKRETDPLKKKREDKLKCHVCMETFRERHHLTRHMTAHQDRAEEMLVDEGKLGSLNCV